MPLHNPPCTWPQEGCSCDPAIYIKAVNDRIHRYATQHKFIQSVTRLKVAFQDVNAFWENLSKEDQEILINKYPFDDTLEGIMDDVVQWSDSIIEGWKL